MGEIIRRTKEGRFLGWYLRYIDADGKRKQRASHQPSRELARRMLVEIEARIARGLVGMMEPAPPAPTVAELIERFLGEYSRPAIKDLSAYRAHARSALRRTLPLLGERPADSLTAADIGRLREVTMRLVSPGSARLTLAYFASMYAWAVREKLVPHNPLRGVEKPQSRDLVEYLSVEEVRLLIAAAERRATGNPLEQRLRALVHLALRTGLRKGELLGLRWRDLDLDTRRLTVARSFATTPKSGKARHLRLPAAVVPILAEWVTHCPHTAEALVFPGRCSDGTWGMVRKTGAMLGLPELLTEAGCRPLSRAWHALRHTFASHYIMSGGNLLALQKILGHSDVKMTMVYAHLAPEFLGEEMDRIKF